MLGLSLLTRPSARAPPPLIKRCRSHPSLRLHQPLSYKCFLVTRTLVHTHTHTVSFSLSLPSPSNYLFTEQSHFTNQATALCSCPNER